MLKFVKNNTVTVIAAMCALVTCFFVPPDMEYIGYFDFKTLACLFCTLAVVCALKRINFFYIIARKIIKCFKTTRMSILALVYITFLGSMLLANDMALLTFLPLGFMVLHTTGKTKYMAVTFVLQNIAANLGGMLTPFGNPQNLYLYSHFLIPTGEFMSIMAPPFVLAVVLITICCLLIKSENLEIDDIQIILDPVRTISYLVLFALSIAIVFRTVPYIFGTAVVVVLLYFFDKKVFKDVDYGLILTFAFFFIFSGNLARIDAVSNVFSALLKKSTLLFSALLCQFISNVPSAILLSQFTNNYRELLYGVNIGGTGTLIASLASLITFREYTRHNKGKALYYITLFSAFNFAFLAILILACYYFWC